MAASRVFRRWRATALQTIGPVGAAILLTSGAAVSLQGQARLTGQVTGGEPTLPLAGAVVEIRGTDRRATTNAAGEFTIDRVPAGEHVVTFRHVGFQPEERHLPFADGETIRITVLLAGVAVVLDSVTVVADDVERLTPRMAGFSERRSLGLGRFLDSRELEQRPGRDMESILRELNVPLQRGQRGLYAAESRGPSTLLGPKDCPAKVLIDGMLMNWSRSDTLWVHQFPNPRLVAGIEFYSSAAQLPLQFQTDESSCGVLVIWMRSQK